MNKIYWIEELKRPNIFQRLFKKESKENALIELNNLLATKQLKEITLEEISEISSRYNVDLHHSFLTQLRELYERYLNRCFEDNVLSDSEVEELGYLRHLLILEEHEVSDLHEKSGGEIFKKSYDDSISNGSLEKSKEEFLDKLQKNLRLPDRVAEKISLESRHHLLDVQLNKITEDGKISPDEWEELTLIAKNLNVNISVAEASKAKLEKMKLYWLLENGEIPVLPIGINLQKNEVCYFSTYAEWLENRTVTQRINYGGLGYSIKIMKGVYYRAGSVKVQKITSEQLLRIDSGDFYITNKRIIFVGAKKNANILLSKVLSIIPYSDGVGIEKDSGKSPIIRVKGNADILAMTLGRVINDLQN